MELRLANEAQERTLVEARKEKNVLQEKYEAKLSKVRKAERANTLDTTASQSLEERFESFLAAVSLYLTALDAPDVKQLGPARLAEHFKLVRARLTKINDEVTLRFKRVKKALHT